MSYDNPTSLQFKFEAHDFGTGSDVVKELVLPSGKVGRIRDILLTDITENFAGSTSTPGIKIGTTADDDAYVTAIDFGTPSAGDVYSAKATSATPFVDSRVTADTEFHVTLVSGVGTPTGIADVTILIDCY